MRVSELVGELILQARELAVKLKHEYMTPEHVMYVLCTTEGFPEVFESCGGNTQVLRENLESYLTEDLEEIEDVEPMESFALQQALILASEQVLNSGKNQLEIDHVLAAILELPESYGAYYVLEQGVTKRDLLFELCHVDEEGDIKEKDADLEDDGLEDEMQDKRVQDGASGMSKYATNLSELAKTSEDPLVGREDILQRTLQVLCRREKNNPIHIGEPGVGKTAITMGLAKLINEGKVPKALQGGEIFALDLGAMLAGTQYRGDFEKRIKKVLDSLKKHEKPIIYIDEIHNIVGAGALGGGSLDASNLLKPYLTEGKVRFIGATTFEEYKKYFEKDKSLARRFQTIEVKEPTVEETIKILEGLKANYETYHGVTYTLEAIEAAAKLSHQYMNDKFLPDKAIDLIDEAGAYMAMKESKKGKKTIDTHIIEETIAKICHVPKQTVESNEMTKLKKLEPELKSQIFGQDKAVEEVVRAIKMSRAGLGDSDKPVASMLFVGPTGVGKTEIAKCLAKDLGIKLIRFDMSEYTEKHTASKLIGAPAGYVGYEEGGLLTDAIRKTPHCVLLLDEIEKAHTDIFNMLLQVMDYATLTDNQGKKADFRNVILLMTSNAGASSIGKSLVGFGERVMQGEAIVEEVKKVFTPEFRNRLNGVVAFNHINHEMAISIAEKELKRFKQKLEDKQIKMSFTKKCVSYIADKGTSQEYGAREIARLVEREVKPLLVDEILFGKLAKGGKCRVNVVDGKFGVSMEGKEI